MDSPVGEVQVQVVQVQLVKQFFAQSPIQRKTRLKLPSIVYEEVHGDAIPSLPPPGCFAS